MEKIFKKPLQDGWIEVVDSVETLEDGTEIKHTHREDNPAPNTYPKYAEAKRYWVDENGYTVYDRGDFYEFAPIEPKPEPTPEEIKAEAKAERKAAEDAIVVTVDGMPFDGDERSQARMANAVACMSDTEVRTWILADDTRREVTREQLRKAFKLAEAEFSRLRLSLEG